MTRDASTLLVAAGVVLVVGYFGATWAGAATGPAWSQNTTTLVGVQGPTDHGQVVAIGPDGEAEWRVTHAASYHDVSRLDDGRVLASYAIGGQQSCGRYTAPCAETGFRLLTPEPANDTARAAGQWSYPVRTLPNSEVHDAERLPGGDYLVVGMDRERIMVIDADFRRVETLWNASEYYDAPADPTREDWLHMNDVDRLPDGRIMVSVRNANQIVILAENATGWHVDEVINADSDPTVIRGQHNPQWLGPGAVLVADSGNDRVVELHRNDSTGAWEPVWAVTSANGILFAWPRDADRLANGHTVITDSRNNRLVEVDETGATVGAQSVPALPYEADVGGTEPVGGPTLGGEDVPPGDGEHDLGLIGVVTVGLQHAYPLPYWIGEWHVLVTLVGFALMNAGIAMRAVPWLRRTKATVLTGPEGERT